MKKYIAKITLGLTTIKRAISANNKLEAQNKALDIAYKESNYGEGKFLSKVIVEKIKEV